MFNIKRVHFRRGDTADGGQLGQHPTLGGRFQLPPRKCWNSWYFRWGCCFMTIQHPVAVYNTSQATPGLTRAPEQRSCENDTPGARSLKNRAQCNLQSWSLMQKNDTQTSISIVNPALLNSINQKVPKQSKLSWSKQSTPLHLLKQCQKDMAALSVRRKNQPDSTPLPNTRKSFGVKDMSDQAQ